jgi:Pyridoxamine 5'-phosphate oxidase
VEQYGGGDVEVHATGARSAVPHRGRNSGGDGDRRVAAVRLGSHSRGLLFRPPPLLANDREPEWQPHVVPVFAAWDDDDRCFIATNANARKTRDLIASGRCVLAANTGDAHVVVEATARRVDSADEMEHASTAFREVYDWPTTVCLRRAPYAVRGPTSGGSPFQVWELRPTKAFGFAADG